MNDNVKLGRAAARSGEWAQHFSNASCFVEVNSHNLGGGHVSWGSYAGFNFAGWRGGCDPYIRSIEI